MRASSRCSVQSSDFGGNRYFIKLEGSLVFGMDQRPVTGEAGLRLANFRIRQPAAPCRGALEERSPIVTRLRVGARATMITRFLGWVLSRMHILISDAPGQPATPQAAGADTTGSCSRER